MSDRWQPRAPDEKADLGDGLTRRQLLVRGGGGAAAITALAGAAFGVTDLLGDSAGVDRAATRLPSSPSTPGGSVLRFRSRQDLLPPAVAATGRWTAPGHLVMAPGSARDLAHGPPAAGPRSGPMIVDRDGQLVWFRPLAGVDWATNVSVWSYRGQPVLAWWQGKVIDPGFGLGEGILVDDAYREVARVRAGNGRVADLHEFRLTPQGTAFVTCYPEPVTADLSSFGGPTDGQALESVFQEIDVRTGRVLFEWHSLDHVEVSESHQPYNEPYDYMHINSVDVLPDGNLLVSGRATWALYKLDRRTGEVIWRLGGKRSDFALGHGASFAWQHDASHAADGVITLFDNGAGPVQTKSQSRGIALAVDERRRTARLAHVYHSPRLVLATAMGSVQTLPDGNVFVGWGTAPYANEFTSAGALRAGASLELPLQSYRTFLQSWQATPHDAPALAVRRARRGGRSVMYASWNGATGVSGWRVHAGPTPSRLSAIGTARRQGFETAIPVSVDDGWVAVTAIDPTGRELASSRAVRI